MDMATPIGVTRVSQEEIDLSAESIVIADNEDATKSLRRRQAKKKR